MGKFVKALVCSLFAAAVCVAQQPAARVYTVTNAAAFPSLTAAAGSSLMIFVNGTFQAPPAYVLTTTPTAVSVRFASGVLHNGDKIAIVTLPASVGGPPGATGSAGPAGPPSVGITVETGCATAAGCVVLGTATTLDIEPGIGTLCVPQLAVATGTMTLQCSSDKAIIAFRVHPPAAFPGNCVDPVTGNAYGASTWAAGPDPVTAVPYFYTCILPPGVTLPLPAGVPLIFVWARIPLVTGS